MLKINRPIAEHPSTSSTSKTVWSEERICRLAAVVIASLIIYGSLVPFDLRMPDAFNPVACLEQIRFTSWSHVSRTDLFVNAAVGIPLGVFLRGGVRVARRRSHMRTALVALAMGCLSAILATA